MFWIMISLARYLASIINTESTAHCISFIQSNTHAHTPIYIFYHSFRLQKCFRINIFCILVYDKNKVCCDAYKKLQKKASPTIHITSKCQRFAYLMACVWLSSLWHTGTHQESFNYQDLNIHLCKSACQFASVVHVHAQQWKTRVQ